MGVLHRLVGGRGSKRAPVLEFKLLLHAWLSELQVFFVWMQPALVRIFQRGRKRRHDFPTVPQISPNFRPFLQFTDLLETTALCHCLFQLVQIERALVYAGKSIEVHAVLFVKFGKLVQVVEIGPRA